MSIRTRLEDALCLWNAGRKEGAWIQVLIAAAATARLRYPRPIGDKDAFTRFIREVTMTILDPSQPARAAPGIGMLLGDYMTLDELIYVHMRCHLLHEAELAPKAGLADAEWVVGPQMKLPVFWVWN